MDIHQTFAQDFKLGEKAVDADNTKTNERHARRNSITNIVTLFRGEHPFLEQTLIL